MKTASPALIRRLQSELQSLPDAAVDEMQRGAAMCVTGLQSLAATGRSTVTAVLGDRQVLQWEHYPDPDDVFDRRSGSQYFFHCHSADSARADEHGHFHLFGRAGHDDAAARRDQPYTHLLGIAVDAQGLPVRLFTTNRWVTGEQWLPGAGVLALIDRFSIARRQPSAVLHQWLRGMLLLFRPQIERLLAERDAWLDRALVSRPAAKVMEDRRTHVISAARVDFFAQLQAVYGIE